MSTDLRAQKTFVNSPCKYVSQPKSRSGTFSLLYYNARSLIPKLDNLHALVNLHKPDAICIVESWLCPNIAATEIGLPGYNTVRLDRDRHGGGIVLFVSDVYNVKVLQQGPLNLEFLLVSVQCAHFRLILALFYRPPSSSTVYFDCLYSVLESIHHSYFSNFVLVGDFNIDFCNPSHNLYQRLLTILSSFSLTQVVPSPTHTSCTGNSTLIDLALVSSPAKVNCSVIPPIGTSDHLGVKLTIKTSAASKHTGAQRLIWRYSAADWEKACEMLNIYDWDQIFIDDVNHAWTLWEKKFMAVMLECIPRVQISKHRNLPWVSKNLKRAMQKRNQLFRRAHRYGNTRLMSLYKMKRNEVTQLLRNSKKDYFEKMLPNTKQFWKTVRLLKGANKTIPTLLVNNCEVSSDSEKVEALSDYFRKCFNDSVPCLTSIDVQSIKTVPDSCPEHILCTEEEVLSLLQSLDVTKASGPEGISARMLKGTAVAITPVVTKLFNLSLKSGTFPQAAKMSLIMPIPKSLDPTSPSNYRPISLLSILSKVLERHVSSHIFEELDLSCHPAFHQWGFRPGHSTGSALTTTIDDWLRSMDLGKPVCSVFFDVRKAFDSIPHATLVSKLQSLGLNDFILRWICDYLRGREQRVILNGVSSRPKSVLSGVPQGSVLGPLLFTIYINDLADLHLSSKLVLYADDILLYRSIETSADYNLIQEDVNNIEQWMVNNSLTLNTAKCKQMLITRTKTHHQHQLYLSDQPLEQVQNYKYLGVTITSNLSWSDHIQSVCLKSRRLVGLLYRQFYNANLNTLRQFYLSCIRPHLEYACTVWDPYITKDIMLLENVQKFACKVICKSWSMDYNSMLAYLDIPSLKQRRLHLKTIMMFKFVHRSSYIPVGYLLPNPPSNYNMRNLTYFTVPYARTNAYYNSFFPHMLRIWNRLPLTVVCAPSSFVFKKVILSFI